MTFYWTFYLAFYRAFLSDILGNILSHILSHVIYLTYFLTFYMAFNLEGFGSGEAQSWRPRNGVDVHMRLANKLEMTCWRGSWQVSESDSESDESVGVRVLE